VEDENNWEEGKGWTEKIFKGRATRVIKVMGKVQALKEEKKNSRKLNKK